MIDPISVSVGRTYAVTDAADCTVTDESGRVLCEHKAGSSQSYFTATTQTVTVTSATVHVTEVFNGAPAQNGSGGGDVPESPTVTELVNGAADSLADGRVYHIDPAPDGGFDFSALTVAPNATARIWLDAGTGPVVFPEAWVWSDSDTFQLPAEGEEPQGVGDFVEGETYLLTVCRYKYGAKDFTIANRAVTVQPATA